MRFGGFFFFRDFDIGDGLHRRLDRERKDYRCGVFRLDYQRGMKLRHFATAFGRNTGNVSPASIEARSTGRITLAIMYDCT